MGRIKRNSGNVNTGTVGRHNLNISGNNNTQVAGEKVIIPSDEGKDLVIEKQEREVRQMFDALMSQLDKFHAVSANRNAYIEKQDQYISEIIKHSYLRNKENMERIDKLVRQQNKILEMVIQQNEKTQNRADRIVEALIKANENKLIKK